ncbi:MAG: SDR family NAD(P)-dependent oxidoreductase [Proteobacteria bacterium]|nr:MAG: SDR family NAD(P)-dependent oxidoreductase [Pseudomonadota bacterium]
MVYMKALITGGAGFLGRKLARALLDEGHEVRLLVRKIPSEKPAPGEPAELQSMPVSYQLGDLADEASLEAACQGMDWVFHAAGVISYNPKKADLMYRTNVIGTRNVCTAALAAGVKRLVFTSSTAAIGVNEDPSTPMREDTPFNARRLGLAYFDTKFDAEEEVRAAVKKGLDAVIVNPGSLMGPGDTRRYEKGYVGLIYKYKPPVRFHGGINFVDVNDVVKGHLLALKKGRTGERYILGGESLTYGALIERVNKLIGRKAPKATVPRFFMGMLAQGIRGLNLFGVDIHMTPELVRQVADWYLYVDSEKAKKELGYQPHSIDEAVLSTVTWLKGLGRI